MTICAFGTFNSIASNVQVHVPPNPTRYAAHDAGFTQSLPDNRGGYPPPGDTNGNACITFGMER
jgi:hypothetical protein